MTAQATAKQMPTPTITNGVNVKALFDTIAAIKADPTLARFNFRATNRWQTGDKNCTTIKEFTGAGQEHRKDAKPFVFWNGEHQVLLGEDKAPNPVEWVLHALIGCMTTTLAYHAASRGIAIDGIESGIDGDIDLRGFLGLSDQVRNGYSKIRVTMRVKSTASPTTLTALVKLSPVYDVVSKSVPVDVTITTC
jgi:uncharacterized OsmC-like protein